MNKYKISWADIFRRWEILKNKIPKNSILYGVPNGGMLVLGHLLKNDKNYFLAKEAVNADIIIDDIIDSGKTKNYYRSKFPSKPFYALIDKTTNDYNIGWIIFPWEKDHPNKNSVTDAVIRQLQYIGEDVTREGLKDTPKRVVKSWDSLFDGYKINPDDVITTFKDDCCDEMVLLKNIEFYSTCEHHLLPFYGKAHIAYIPNGQLIGISKLARILDIYAHRAQIQERIGEQVTSCLEKYLQPKGTACIIEAQHLCMQARGVQKQNSVMVTSSLTGVFHQNEVKNELLKLIGK